MKENDKYSVWKLYSIIKSPGDVQYDIYIRVSASFKVLHFRTFLRAKYYIDHGDI